MAWFARRTPQAVLAILSPAHAEACAALHGTAFAHGWPPIEFERLIGSRSSTGDAALVGRSMALAGFVLSRGAAGEAEILTIAVAAEWRGRGLGRRLIDRHMARLAGDGVGALFLEVNESNAAARALYRAAGFAEVGRRKAYYPGTAGQPPEAALILRCDLR